VTAQRSLLGEYLRARRALVQPEDVGLPRDPSRRVAGLRREEVAALAAISPDYYLRLEQGRTHQPSDQVLVSLGRALALDQNAVTHLFRIARPGAGPRRTDAARAADDPHLVGLLAQWPNTPAFILDSTQTVVLANPLARALGAGYTEVGSNLVLAMFSEPMRQTSPDWETAARDSLAALRYHSDPDDPRLQELVRTLQANDADFRRLWARHDARPYVTGSTRTVVEGVGPVDLRFQNFAVPGHDGHTLTAFFDEPGTQASAALAYLAAQGEVVLSHGPHAQLR
jgi:transcriptional regulator with XRE-family HTH domain